MDVECSQLLPQVCKILTDNRQLVSDDSCLEKLLDWFKCVINTAPAEQVLGENQCIVRLLQQVVCVGDAEPHLISFAMRLVGIFAAQKGGFQYLMNEGIVQGMLECVCSDHVWKDASVRSGWIQGLHSMVQNRLAINVFSNSGAVDIMLNLQTDSSLFVASAAKELVAYILFSSVKMELDNPKGNSIDKWPDLAQRIFAHLEKSLGSGISSSVTQSIKTLIAVFRSCTDEVAVIIWSHVAILIKGLLDAKSVNSMHHLEDLLLAVARFPVFSKLDSDLWHLIKMALKNLNLFQANSLALGIMKIKHCPHEILLQAASVLFYPLDCILRSSATQRNTSGLLDELACDHAAVENLMAVKSSCATLLCQCLSHVKELCLMDSLPIHVPDGFVLRSVLIILQFCIDQAAPASQAGSRFSKFLIGSLRVQRTALDTIGALSNWPICSESLVETYKILSAYLDYPDTHPTVLKKALQASVKWLQVSSSAGDTYWTYSQKFLQDLIPVLMKRLCSPSWEIRDSTLEFLTHLTNVFNVTEHDRFKQVFTFSGIPRLVLDLLKDPESYVRASAVSCMGQIICDIQYNSSLADEEDGITSETTKMQDIVPILINILSQDTEGFPRRAVVSVFRDWLKNGHLQHMEDSQQLLTDILEIAIGDLDWEVKMNALDLASVFVSQTFAVCGQQSCPYTVELMNKESLQTMSEVIQKCNQIGLLYFLLDTLGDCDRPVALKSCDILISVKSKMCEGLSASDSLTSELHGAEWLECALRDWKKSSSSKGEVQEINRVLDILKKVNLDNIKCCLSKSSDHIHKTPQSLLQDIMASAETAEENEADCY
ncbi:BRCA1-associated ATM activator 1 [Bombina bombina]|uniref:BRCA1-associated ATM activator 1 n=1 Tax=Bombina bombina TaxID=8345 RepID=UPI00235AD7DA|nr:BRCA1-associated ATM activator 1 [Bombina bombina]